jgi:hypothetical protein
MVFELVRAYLVLDSPKTTSPVAGLYWGIDATIQYGGSNGSGSVGNTNTTWTGFIDTGTSLVYIPGKLLRDSRPLPDMCTQTHNTHYVSRIKYIRQRYWRGIGQ